MSNNSLLNEQNDILNELRKATAKAMRMIGPAIQNTLLANTATDKYTSFRVTSTTYPELTLDVIAKATVQSTVLADAVEYIFRISAPYITVEGNSVPETQYPDINIVGGVCELYDFMRLVQASNEWSLVYGVNGFVLPLDTCIVKWP